MRKQIDEGAIRYQTDILLYNIFDILLDIRVLMEEIASSKKPASRGAVKNYLPPKTTANKGKGGEKDDVGNTKTKRP